MRFADATDGAASEPVVVHDYQDAQYYGSLVVGTPSEEIKSAMTQAHPICGCPTQIVALVLKSQFLPQLRSNTYVANASTFSLKSSSHPVSSFHSEDTVNGVEASIAEYTFTGLLRCLHWDFVLSVEILTKSAAWLVVHFLFHFVDRVRTLVEYLVDAGAKPVFAVYLGKQTDEKLTIDGVNNVQHTRDFARPWVTKRYWCSYKLASDRPGAVSLTRYDSSVCWKSRLLSAIHASSPQR